jgi:polar amino acid transport system substrate-binding protein
MLGCISLTGCPKRERGLTIEDGILIAGVEIGYPPMEYYDTDGKTPAGFDIELCKALADAIGLRIRFIDVAWEGILAGLKTDKYDIAVNVTITPQRQKMYNFTKPYIDNSMTIVTCKDSFSAVHAPQDIAFLRAAFQGDTTAQFFAERLNSQIPFTLFAYDKIINCFDDLKLGRVDCVIVDSLAAFDYAGKKQSPFTVAWQGPTEESIAICLKKDNDALTEALNKALIQLLENGTLLRISRDFFGCDLVSGLIAY